MWAQSPHQPHKLMNMTSGQQKKIDKEERKKEKSGI
jgi:hypothetical protein